MAKSGRPDWFGMILSAAIAGVGALFAFSQI